MSCAAEDLPAAVSPSSSREAHLAAATGRDIADIHALLARGVASGAFLPRTPHQLARRLRDFTVLRSEDALEGVGSLSMLTPTTAELGVLTAASPALEARLLDKLLADAVDLGATRVLVLTNHAAPYTKRGFTPTTTGAFPEKHDYQCLRCAKRPSCRQQALVWDGVS